MALCCVCVCVSVFVVLVDLAWLETHKRMNNDRCVGRRTGSLSEEHDRDNVRAWLFTGVGQIVEPGKARLRTGEGEWA